jgi:hypothetical protein
VTPGRIGGRRPAATRLCSALALILLGGCFSSARDQTIETPPSSLASLSPAGPLPSSSPSPIAGGQSRSLVLRPGGIDALSFEAPADQVLATLGAALGPPGDDRKSAGCESGADRTVTWPNLYAVFSNGKWVGYLWDDGAGAPSAATDKGIKVGSTVAELKAAYPHVSIGDTTLGLEWFVEVTDTTSLGGFVSGSATAGKVERIYSGDICAFR